MSEALKIKEKNEDSLRKIEGIIGVGLHNSTGVILLYAPEITPQILREVPKTLDGVPVKIIRTGGKFTPLPIAMTVPPAYAIYLDRTMRIRPCPGGISVGAPQITAGTLTCRAVDTKTAKVLGLSNAHVLYTPWGTSEGAGKGNQVLQPGSYDGGKVPDDVIGSVDRWVPVVLDQDNLVDIAGFETGEVAPEIIELGKPSSVIDPAVGDAIVKSGRCFTKDTLILTNPDGPKTVDNLEIGDSVYCFNGVTLEKSKIKDVLSQGIRQVFQVRTRNKTVEVTENHPFLVAIKEKIPVTHRVVTHPRNKHGSFGEVIYKRRLWINKWRLQWKEVSDLNGGDLIVTLHHIENEGLSSINPTFARFLGFFVGDGMANYHKGKGGRIILYCANIEEAKHYKLIVERVFKETFKILRCKRCKHQFRSIFGSTCSKCGCHKTSFEKNVTRKAFISHRKNMFMVSFHSANAAKKVLELIPGKKLGKRVPSEIWSWSGHSKRQFLEGFCDADGHRYRCYSQGKTRVYSFGSTNEVLMKEIRELFMMCGIRVTNIYSRRKKGYRECVNWDFKVYPDSKKKKNKATTLKGTAIVNAGISKLQLPKTLQLESIVKIEKSDEKETFDIEVADYHNFIGNGILLHNTSGVTFGSIIDVNATLTVSGWGDATFKDQITMSKVLDPGDSGSLVMKRDTAEVVGVGHAGSPEVSVACKAKNVESLLGVQIVSPQITLPDISSVSMALGAVVSALIIGKFMSGGVI